MVERYNAIQLVQTVHQSLAALSKVIRGSQLLNKDEQILAAALLNQSRRRQSGRTASAGPLFWPSMLSPVSLFLVSAHFTFYSDFIQSAKIYWCNYQKHWLRMLSIDRISQDVKAFENYNDTWLIS